MIAEGFIRNGAKVYIASRDAKACAAVATELSRKGPGKCYAVSMIVLIVIY
jgi:NADP-dependent 3-hydroxy acid dehydrogenase YdfG